jgi:hypothetical protein
MRFFLGGTAYPSSETGGGLPSLMIAASCTGMPAWKQFLDLFLPVALLNTFIITMVFVNHNNDSYLDSAISVGMTMAFFLESRQQQQKVQLGLYADIRIHV